MKKLALVLVLLVGCNGGPTPNDPGTLHVTPIWEGFDTYPASCAGAWAESIWVELESAEGDYSDQAFPCDNSEVITLELIAVGDWTVTLRTNDDPETSENGWNISEPTAFSMTSGGTVDLDVGIVCHDDGVEDRCSGL